MTILKHSTSLPRPVRDLSGQSFGRLIPQRYVGGSRWECLCACGQATTVQTGHLISGHTSSCGCLHRESGGSKPIHGLSRHPIYKRWQGMLDRCYSPTHHKFPLYGGRGITVCERWRQSVLHFYADMGDPPAGMTLDRYPDTNGPYSPENCRWATRTQQARNKRQNHLLTFNNETHSVAEWAEKHNVKVGLYYSRLRANWSTEEVLMTPVLSRQDHRRSGRTSGGDWSGFPDAGHFEYTEV
jgi:hypothetical protein